MQKAYLVLENGTVFEGESFGAKKPVIGEVVFTTAMTGYLETLTDPSYYGQIVVQTFPLIGNYGVIPSDFESEKPHLKAYIVREWCQEPSNYRCEGDLDTFLKEQDIPGLCGIDTRRLTRIVREHGVMNAKIVYDQAACQEDLTPVRDYRIVDAVGSVSSGEREIDRSEQGLYQVVLWDFGAKGNIKEDLLQRGCDVITVPANTKAADILALHPDGLMLSNGPGDPSENTQIIAELAKVLKERIPAFGICLGHQLMALSQGAKTMKLKYGHRGANQPACDIDSGRVYITSQNHGYAVVSESLPEYARANIINGNDQTCEGIEYTGLPAFSVQFHPEACGGPLDTAFLFDRFVSMIGEEKANAKK